MLYFYHLFRNKLFNVHIKLTGVGRVEALDNVKIFGIFKVSLSKENLAKKFFHQVSMKIVLYYYEQDESQLIFPVGVEG